MSGFAFEAPDADDESSETSPEILADLREMGAISRDEARRISEPPPPERALRWEERVRLPSGPRPGYDTEGRFLKDITYGRNREGPAPPPRRPAAEPPAPPPPSRGRAGVSFEEMAPKARPTPPREGRPLPPNLRGRPRGRDGVVLRASQVGPPPQPVRPIPSPPLPSPARPRYSQGGMPEYPYGSTAAAETAPSPAARALAERCAADEARRLEEQRVEFVRDFRRANAKASESDAETAWEARRRASTIEL